MRHKILLLLSFLLPPAGLVAQEKDSLSLVKPEIPDSLLLTNEFLDTVKIHKQAKINDYNLIGVNYGVTFASAYFNPSKHNKASVITPNYVSLTFTHFSKLFDQLPYCAFVVGFAYGHEGYSFKAYEDGTTESVDGATWCSMQVLEIPAMTQIHFDFDPFKIMANIGVYGGYRKSIQRSGPGLTEYLNSFKSYERRIDYGFQGGAGFGIILSPIEIHFNCLVRWSWSNLYMPDYYSKYYYRFAYPLDIIATVGIHFQLTKRYGKTNSQLRSEAHRIVYGN